MGHTYFFHLTVYSYSKNKCQIDCRQTQINCLHKHENTLHNTYQHQFGLKGYLALAAWFMVQQFGFKLLLKSSLIYQDLLMSPKNEVNFLCREEKGSWMYNKNCQSILLSVLQFQPRKFHPSIQKAVVLSAKNLPRTALLFLFCRQCIRTVHQSLQPFVPLPNYFPY